MNEKKMWVTIGTTSLVLAAGLGAAIYLKMEQIDEARAAVSTLEAEIAKARRTIEGTAPLEREVIVLREIAGVFSAILPGSAEVNNLIQNFYTYSGEAGVEPTSFKPKPVAGGRGRTSDFDQVSYALTLSGDTFQFLEFLNRIETHSRFMAVPSFQLTSVSRQDMEKFGYAKHKIQLDVETYVYVPQRRAKNVSIEGYARKRDLLAGEINRRRQALTLSTFHYRGNRGRRDPWVDPRVPIEDNPSGLTVPEQNEKVEQLIGLFGKAVREWDEVQGAENVLDRMVKRKSLIETIAMLEDELRHVDQEGLITFTPAVKRVQKEVRDPLRVLREEIDDQTYTEGPSKEEMEQVLASMQRHIESGDYAIAIAAFGEIKSTLDLVQGDPVRMVLAEELRVLSEDAQILSDFDAIEMKFGGQALIEGRPPAVIINGKTLSPGGLLDTGVEVLAIRPREVDFAFRGVVLTRKF